MAKGKKIDLSSSSLLGAPEESKGIKVVPVEESDLYKEAMKDREVEENDPRLKKMGRPKNQELVRGSSSQYGLTPEYSRASYIMKVDDIQFIKDLAYTERIRVQDALAKVVSIGRKQIEKEYKKEGKELLRKEKIE